MSDGDVVLGLHEEGAIVAGPAPICRVVKKIDRGQIGGAGFQNFSHGALRRCVLDNNADTFDAGQVADDFAV